MGAREVIVRLLSSQYNTGKHRALSESAKIVRRSAQSWQYRDRRRTEVGTMAYYFRITLTKENLDIRKWGLDVGQRRRRWANI